MQITSFSSISNKDAKILILGTMPGIQSLTLNQYYGHSRNAFWKLLFAIFEENFSTDYEKRVALILKHKIALWDVLHACIRIGSLDSAIEEEIPNDINCFLESHPNIEYIFFNGQKAAHYFKKYITVSARYEQVTLPSTSPANASLTFEKKLLAWKIINK